MFSLTLVSLLENHFRKPLKRKKEKSCKQVHCNHKANILEGMSNGKLHDACQALSSVISTPFFLIYTIRIGDGWTLYELCPFELVTETFIMRDLA